MLRNVCGSVTAQEAWRIRIYEEVMELYKTPDLVTDSKRIRLECLGLIVRLNQMRIVKKFFIVSQKVEEKWESPG